MNRENRPRINIRQITSTHNHNWNEQFCLFKKTFEEIVQKSRTDFKKLSFEYYYRMFYKVFYDCKNDDCDVLVTQCVQVSNTFLTEMYSHFLCTVSPAKL